MADWPLASPQMHAFALAAICWAIWKARNRACFESRWIKHPAEIVCHACSLLDFWTGLHKEEMQDQIKEGLRMLLSLAYQMSTTRTPPSLALPPAVVQDADVQETDGHDGA